jgi:hypothetical protein
LRPMPVRFKIAALLSLLFLLTGCERYVPVDLHQHAYLAKGAWRLNDGYYVSAYTQKHRNAGFEFKKYPKGFRGVELKTLGVHFVGFPISQKFFDEMPDKGKLTPQKGLALLKKEGAYTIYAHPKPHRDLIKNKLAGVDALEIWNAGVHKHMDALEPLCYLYYWFGLLQRGYKITAIGVSDAGDDGWLEDINYVKTLVLYNRPWLDVGYLRRQLENHRCIVTNGPIIHFTINGKPVGSDVTADSIVLRIKVDSSETIDAIKIVEGRINAFGEGISKTSTVVANGGVIRLVRKVDEPMWFVVTVQGKKLSYAPKNRYNRALAFTNPIWVYPKKVGTI